MQAVFRHIPRLSVTSAACAFLFIPAIASAQVYITELMYDRDGTDSGHEWLEVYNAGGSAVPLTEWRLYENDTNHHIESFQGGETLAAGDYAIIADKPDVFLSDWPSYDGQVFDSAFSLKNTGETLILRDGELGDIDELAYSSGMGAAGDGNTLHRPSTASDELEPARPSPGSGDVSAPVAAEAETEEKESDAPQQTNTTSESTTQTEQTAQTTNNTGTHAPETIQADAGTDKEVIAGVPAELSGNAYYGDGTPLAPGAATFSWNFGDGTTGSGAQLQHTWEYPGRYGVVLHVSHNGREDAHTIAITATEPQVAIEADTDGVMLTNDASRNLDLSGWHIRAHGATFTIPPNTLLLSRGSVRFGYETMNLTPGDEAVLLYPNGTMAVESGEQSGESEAAQAQQSDTQTQAAAAPPPAAPEPRTNAAPAPESAPQPETDTSGEKAATTSTTSSQVAAAGAAASSFFSLTNPWLIGLLALLAVGALGAAAARAASRSEWTIIEEKD